MSVYSYQNLNKELQKGTDLSKIRSYLYQLNEELNYMFQNLEADNLTDEAYLLLKSDGVDTSSLEMTVDQIKMQVENINSGYSSIKMRTDEIELQVTEKVGIGNVVDELNSELKITSNKIYMGTTGQLVISAGNFRLDEQGNVEISGDIVGGSTIEVGQLYADDEGVELGAFYTYTSSSGGKYLALKDSQRVGIGDYPDFNIWAGAYTENFNNPYFYVKDTGETHMKSIILWSGADKESPFRVSADENNVATVTLNGGKVYPIVSVESLPTTPDANTVYLIQGKVTVS